MRIHLLPVQFDKLKERKPGSIKGNIDFDNEQELKRGEITLGYGQGTHSQSLKAC